MNTSSWKRAAVAALGSAALVLSLGTATAVASDAPGGRVSCYGAGCTGEDPFAMGCARDAYTPGSIHTSHGLVELRYSPSCGANWARITGAPADTDFWVQNENREIRGYTAPGPVESWTDMVDGTVFAHASNGYGTTDWH